MATFSSRLTQRAGAWASALSRSMGLRVKDGSRLAELAKLRYFALLMVASCSTFEDIDEGVSRLYGQPVDNLIAIIGFPDQERTIAGRRLLVWSTTEQVTVFRPVTTRSSGRAEVESFRGEVQANFERDETSFVPVLETRECTIRVQVDPSERIVFHDLRGDLAGCEGYARRIRHTLE